MSYQQAKDLLQKYNNGTCTDAEKALVEQWLFQYNNIQVDLSEERFEAISREIWGNLPQKPIRKIYTWPRIAVAASILLFLSVGAYFALNTGPTEEQINAQNFKNDVAPGTNSATLTLGNGKVIVLNSKANGRLAMQGNMAVTKTADGQLQYQVIASAAGDEVMENTLTTKRKEQYKVILPDGTNVWLNAASSIKYPTRFIGKYRNVIITGEAYFEVAHNAAKPFRVTSAGQTVEVLGTHFNVNTYDDEPVVSTTLLEGSVKVSDNNGFKIIKPGEQAILKDAQLAVKNANIEEAVAWKNGYFRFNKESTQSLMRKLARWYDVDIQFEGELSDDEFSGAISRNTNLTEVLKALQYYKTVHFKIEGRRVTVLK